MLDDPDGQSQKFVDRPHPGAVAAGQIIIDRHHVNAFAGQGVQIRGKCRHQSFPFTGRHFRDIALVEDHPADKLNVKMPHVQDAFAYLAHHGEGFRQNTIQNFFW